MAFQMSYSDEFGHTDTASYWYVVEVSVNKPGRTADVMFRGWRDKDARDTGLASLGSHSYHVDGGSFDTLYAAHTSPGGPNLLTLCYAHAAATKDVVVDPLDPAQNVSFFATASNV